MIQETVPKQNSQPDTDSYQELARAGKDLYAQASARIIAEELGSDWTIDDKPDTLTLLTSDDRAVEVSGVTTASKDDEAKQYVTLKTEAEDGSEKVCYVNPEGTVRLETREQGETKLKSTTITDADAIRMLERFVAQAKTKR